MIINSSSSGGGYQLVKLNMSHNIVSNKIQEVRFDLFQTIESVKTVCYMKFGTAVENMQLLLQDKQGNLVRKLNEDDKTLGFYSPKEFYNIHCIDLNPTAILQNLEDLSQVEKYMMSEEDYDKLPNNMRKFKAFLKENPSFLENKVDNQKKIKITDDYQEELAQTMKVGDRCKMIEFGHRGTVKYIGKIPELGLGWYVGVFLDEPFGKNDGTLYGFKYFECPPAFGEMLRPGKIEVGDFPELDIDDEI